MVTRSVSQPVILVQHSSVKCVSLLCLYGCTLPVIIIALWHVVVGEDTISNIKKKKDDIFNFASKLEFDDESKQIKTTRTANETTLKDTVYLWFTQRRSLGKPVTGPLICEKALQFHELLGDFTDFKQSTGWLKNVKARHGIQELYVEGESLSSDCSAAVIQDRIFGFCNQLWL